MKHPFFTILLYFIFANTIIAQKNIKAGIGFDDIYIGTTIQDATKILGEPTLISSRKDEKIHWATFGYDLKKSLVFSLKFDQVYLFEEYNEYMIWKIYTKKGKIVNMNISSFVHSKENKKRITVLDKNYFFSPPAFLKDFKGDNPLIHKDYFGYLEFIYFKEGIQLIFDNNKLSNVFIFKPMKKKKRQKLRKKLIIK